MKVLVSNPRQADERMNKHLYLQREKTKAEAQSSFDFHFPKFTKVHKAKATLYPE